eukprot:UN22712
MCGNTTGSCNGTPGMVLQYSSRGCVRTMMKWDELYYISDSTDSYNNASYLQMGFLSTPYSHYLSILCDESKTTAEVRAIEYEGFFDVQRMIVVSSDVCHFTRPKCINELQWDAGFGGCGNYPKEGKNYLYCCIDPTLCDYDGSISAKQSCSGCGYCDDDGYTTNPSKPSMVKSTTNPSVQPSMVKNQIPYTNPRLKNQQFEFYYT